MKLKYKVLLIIGVLLLADQAVKIYVKTHFNLYESVSVMGDRVLIYFTENNGMAFGMEFWGSIGKLLLTVFRIGFIGFIVWYLAALVRQNSPLSFVYAVAVMVGGAMGNLLDCLFYGIIFNASTVSSAAEMFPPHGGYAPFLFGKVVDMFYCPVINVTLPEWLPVRGGTQFIFFRPIFNIADAAITCSIFYLLFFQRKMLAVVLGASNRLKGSGGK